MKQHTKTLGQVFLHDSNIIKKIITLADPLPTDSVIEIGCGKGILTNAMAPLCKQLDVIEIDKRWIETVQTNALDNVTFHHKDVLTVDFSLFKNSKVIANIPYQITTPILEHLIKYKHLFSSITIMIQKEVADRITSPHNSKIFGLLSLFCNYHFDINKGFNVSRECFSPKPNVDSKVIQLIPKKGILNKTDEPLFFAMTKSLFWGRRKTIINCLLNAPHIQCNPAIKTIHLPERSKRAEQLSLSDHISLFKTIKNQLQLPT